MTHPLESATTAVDDFEVQVGILTGGESITCRL